MMADDLTAGSGAHSPPKSTPQSSNDDACLGDRSRRVQLQLSQRNGSPSGEALAAMEEGKRGTINNRVILRSNEPLDGPVVSWYRRVSAEAVSTFFLVFAGCGSSVVDKKSQGAVSYLGVCLVFGLVIMAMIKAVGHISGAHMNPAITIAFASIGDFPLTLMPFYIIAQSAGAICAAFVLRAILDSNLDADMGHLGATTPVGSNVQGFAMEFVLTMILMFVVCAVAVDGKAVGELAGLILGGTITMNAVIGGAITGASMNPARSLGPAVAASQYKGLWVYIFAPTLGAVAGAWLYTLLHGSQQLASESRVQLSQKGSHGSRHKLKRRRSSASDIMVHSQGL